MVPVAEQLGLVKREPAFVATMPRPAIEVCALGLEVIGRPEQVRVTGNVEEALTEAEGPRVAILIAVADEYWVASVASQGDVGIATASEDRQSARVRVQH